MIWFGFRIIARIYNTFDWKSYSSVQLIQIELCPNIIAAPMHWKYGHFSLSLSLSLSATV